MELEISKEVEGDKELGEWKLLRIDRNKEERGFKKIGGMFRD